MADVLRQAQDEVAKRHLDRFRALGAARGSWDNHWEDLARLMLPRRSGFAATNAAGARRVDDLFDGTPMQAARGLANAIGGMLRPDGQKWFFLRAVDDAAEESDEAKDWLADTEERLREAFIDPKARFRQATGEADLDLVVFGTAVIFESESRALDHLLFQSVHLKDAYPYFDAEGTAAGLYRARMLTVRQAVENFGLGAVSESTREKWRKEKYEDTVAFVHCVVRRESGRPDALLARNAAFTDLWIESTARRVVRDGGFREFPFIVARWDTSSGEDYGRSPGMIALPDASTLQAMGETLLIAGQRAADPPLAAPADGSFNEINTVPGGLAYYDPDTVARIGRAPFFPIESGANMPLTREMQHDMREQVFRAFLRNILNLPVDGPQMTATEVMQRKEEFLREIGPVFGRLETDYTAPMVERAFKLMLRGGAFRPVPPALQGLKVRFEYESPVKRIRQQVEAAAARIWVQDHIQAAQATGKMDILDAVNFDAYSQFSAEASSLPHTLINGPERIAAIRTQREKLAEEQRQAAMAKAIAETLDKGAGALDKAGLVTRASSPHAA